MIIHRLARSLSLSSSTMTAALSLTGSLAGGVLLGLLTTVVWTRGMPVEVYGEYQTLLSLLAAMAGFSLRGLGESALLSASTDHDGNLHTIVRHKMVAAVLVSILVGTAVVFQLWTPPIASSAILAALLMFPLLELGPIAIQWLTGKRRYRAVAVLNGAVAGFPLLVLLSLVGLGIQDSSITSAAMICATALVFLLAMKVVKGTVHQTSATDQGAIRYGYHATLAAILTGLLAADRLIVASFLSVSDVAIFAVASLFPAQIKALYSVVSSLTIPDLARAPSIEASWRYLKRRFALLFLLFSILGIGGAFAFPIFVPLLFSERYVESIPYACALWLALAVTAPCTSFGDALRAQRKLGFLYLAQNVLSLLGLIAYLGGVIVGGLWGIVIGRMIVNVLGALVYGVTFNWYRKREQSSCSR